jgi:hypothetical protein
VQALRLADLTAALPGLLQISWESETYSTDEGFKTATSLSEIHLEVDTPPGKVWISLGAGDIDDQSDRFLNSLLEAADIEEIESDFEGSLAAAADVLGLPSTFDAWTSIAGLALGYVEETGATGGVVEIARAQEAAATEGRPALCEGLAGALAMTSAKAAGHTVESYLITSTGHVTAAERDLFDAGKTPAPWMVVSLSGDYGWLIHLSDALPESIPGLSDGLAAVIQHARAHGLHYIRFDADGPFIEGAPTYEW